MLSKIKKIEVITSSYRLNFENDLTNAINKFQDMNYDVEIQYKPSYDDNMREVKYSALVIAKEHNM